MYSSKINFYYALNLNKLNNFQIAFKWFQNRPLEAQIFKVGAICPILEKTIYSYAWTFCSTLTLNRAEGFETTSKKIF